jgi:hypothetical protein
LLFVVARSVGFTTELFVFLTAFATSFTLLTPSGLLFVTLALSECLGLRMVVVVVINGLYVCASGEGGDRAIGWVVELNLFSVFFPLMDYIVARH